MGKFTLEEYRYKVNDRWFAGVRKVFGPPRKDYPRKGTGNRERARRRRQIAKGMLQVTPR